MAWQYNWYVFSLAANTVLAVILFSLTWKLKSISGVKYFALSLLACSIWNFTYIFELSSTLLNIKILFTKISYLGVGSVSVFWFFFAINFSQKYKINKSRILFWIIPAIAFVAAWTNEYHGLYWTNISLSNSPYGVVAVYRHGFIYYIFAVYSYLLLSAGSIILIKEALDFPRIYFRQTIILVLAVCVPWFCNALYAFGFNPMGDIDPSVYYFTISAALIVFGYLRLNLFSIAPIAHNIVLSNIVEGIIITDPENRLIETNLFAEILLAGSLNVGGSVEQTMVRIFPGLDFNNFLTEQEILTSYKDIDAWYEFKVSQVKNFRGDILGKIILFRDVTERKKADEALRQSEKNLRELNEVKNRFFSILSHDLRSPFSGLLGFAESLKEDYNSLSDEERKSFLNEIDMTSRNIYSFLEDLLEWSRLNMGSFQAEQVRINLHKEVQNTFHLLAPNAGRKGVILANEINSEEYIQCDPSMIKLLLRNLVSNAIKFSKNGDKVRVYSASDNYKIKISVEDSGVGIPAEAISRLFRLDIKYSTPGTANEKGSGLGLVLCKEILDKLGGEIFVESKFGSGSTFTFTLPLTNQQKSVFFQF